MKYLVISAVFLFLAVFGSSYAEGTANSTTVCCSADALPSY